MSNDTSTTIDGNALAGHRVYLLKIARIQLRDESLAEAHTFQLLGELDRLWQRPAP